MKLSLHHQHHDGQADLLLDQILFMSTTVKWGTATWEGPLPYTDSQEYEAAVAQFALCYIILDI